MQTGPSPSEIRKARRLLIGAMVLAWATHLLVAQWTHGSPVDGSAGGDVVIKVTLRTEARVAGNAIRLGDVCHLEGEGSETLAHRIVEVLATGSFESSVRPEQIASTLEEAGVSPAQFDISGSTRCNVTFTAASPSAAGADSQEQGGEWAGMEPDSAAVAAASVSDDAPRVATRRTLAGRLRADLAARLRVDEASLMLAFPERDEPIASLAAGNAARMTLIRGDDLGRVAWEVEIEGKTRQVTAEATLAVQQLVAARPVARGQTLQPADLAQETKIINRLSDRTPGPAEAIGAAAARSLTQGEIVTAGKLAPRLLADRGQMVVVRVSRGAVEVRLLARAEQDGGFGQVIRATNQQTGDVLYVTLTGPQAGVISPEPTAGQ